MANILPAETLHINVEFNDRVVQMEFVFGDFFKAIYDKCFDVFGIDNAEQAKYALFQDNGARLPKAARIYDNMEIVDGCTIYLRLK